MGSRNKIVRPILVVFPHYWGLGGLLLPRLSTDRTDGSGVCQSQFTFTQNPGKTAL